MIKVGDKVILDGVEYVIKEIKGNDVLLVKRDNALNIMFMNEKTLYAKLYEQQKQRADYLEKYIKIMRDNYSEINKDTQTILRTAPDDVLLKAQFRWNNDVIKILDKILENNNA